MWLLCACGVRRLKGLWRVCSYFYRLAAVFLLLCLLSCFACPLCQPYLFVLSLWLFGCVVGVAFSLTDIQTKRKGAIPCVLSSYVVSCWLDVFKHYRYFLRFIVAISNPFTGDSCHLFRLFHWVVYYLPVFVNS